MGISRSLLLLAARGRNSQQCPQGTRLRKGRTCVIGGNDMTSIMGGNYPGAGITLGPALTFGYIAGKHMADM